MCCAWTLLIAMRKIAILFFRPSVTVSRIGLMESRLRHCYGGPPPPPPWLAAPHVMDGWGTRPLR